MTFTEFYNKQEVYDYLEAKYGSYEEAICASIKSYDGKYNEYDIEEEVALYFELGFTAMETFQGNAFTWVITDFEGRKREVITLIR